MEDEEGGGEEADAMAAVEGADWRGGQCGLPDSGRSAQRGEAAAQPSSTAKEGERAGIAGAEGWGEINAQGSVSRQPHGADSSREKQPQQWLSAWRTTRGSSATGVREVRQAREARRRGGEAETAAGRERGGDGAVVARPRAWTVVV